MYVPILTKIFRKKKSSQTALWVNSEVFLASSDATPTFSTIKELWGRLHPFINLSEYEITIESLK